MVREFKMGTFYGVIMTSILGVLLFVFSLSVHAQQMYHIVKVKPSDTLNLRSEAGVKSDVIAKIPANGDSISLLGARVTIGKTIWVNVNWRGKKGWVSLYFLQPMKIQPKKNATKEKQPSALTVKNIVDKGIGRNQWILRCGNRSPFWRVDVYPKALKVFKGKKKLLLPITYKKQDKNKWNTARKTHLKGAKSKDKVDLVIRYSYQRCNDTLSKQKVPYVAVVNYNGTEMKGCCRAMKLGSNIK